MNIENAVNLRGAHPGGRHYYGWLAEQASKRTLIVEVGSWLGGSARAMAENTHGTVYAVDPWTGTPEMDGDQDFQANKSDPQWLWNGFQRNMAGLSNVVPVRMLSSFAAEQVKHLRFDMVFIDACHEYESVKEDILAWHPLLANGGLFCGHDWGCDGVRRACAELLPEAHSIGIDSLWVWKD